MLIWKLLLLNCCVWSSALVVKSAALTASQLDASDVCRFVRTSLEKKFPGKPDSLYISIGEPKWKSISIFEQLAREFLDYCLKVPNVSKIEDICAQYISDSLQHNNGFHETNYLNRTASIRLLTNLKLIRNSSNSDSFHSQSPVDSPLQLFRTSTSLSRFFLTIYLAGNPGAYRSLDWKLTAGEPIICVENPINNTLCTTAWFNPDTIRVRVSMGKDPDSAETLLNLHTLYFGTHDFIDYPTWYREMCATKPYYSLNNSEFLNCVSDDLQRTRNAILYRYNRLLIVQNVAYWHSGLLGDYCHHITPSPSTKSVLHLQCPSIRLRQRGVTWLKSLLCIGLILASFTTVLNFVLFWLYAFRRGQKGNRLRPYVLNIALIGSLWGLLDAFDYSMMLMGYEMFGEPHTQVDPADPWNIYYFCCSDNLWAIVHNYGSNAIEIGSSYTNSDTYGPSKMNLLIYSISNFLTTYTLQACSMFTFIAIGVIQVYSLMWPLKRSAFVNKPMNNLCFLWVIAVLISILVAGPLAAINIHEVRVNSEGSQFKTKTGQENKNTTVSSDHLLEITSYLTGSADGDSLLLQASTLCGVVIAVLLQSIDGLLAVTLTVLVCYIRRSSSRAVGVGKKHSAGSSNGNGGKISAPTSRTVIVLVTVIMASGISCIAGIPMLHFLFTTHRLADTATCRYDAFSQRVTLDLARTYLLGRVFLLLSPFANPILVVIRYRAVLFPPTIYGPNDNVQIGLISSSNSFSTDTS